MNTAEYILQKYWGYDTFRGVQKEAIESVIAGHDTIVLMATGGGKSLCYCIPPLIKKKLAIVVSPLISLMQDQVMSLKQKNIKAEFVGSAQTDSSVFSRCLNGEYEILYCTPERVVNITKDDACNLNPCLIAIDESHCISEWGHDFRKEYLNLGILREIFPKVPLIALSATATPDTQTQIISRLYMKNVNVLKTTFDRKNLIYSVIHKPENMTIFFSYLINDNDSTIIYAPTTKEVDKITEDLNSNGFKATSYHSKMSQEERTKSHVSFITDYVNIMVATLAYGMGIDKPDVRLVIHFGPPKSLEAYYQQSGRAGRDSQTSKCILMVNRQDWEKLSFIVRSSEHEQLVTSSSLNSMRRYAECEDSCRRLMLIKHFGENPSWQNCGICDNCKRDHDVHKKDATENGKKILQSVLETRGYFGITVPLNMLRGKVQEKHNWIKNLSCFNSIHNVSETQLKRIANHLLLNGLLGETRREGTSRPYCAVILTDYGKSVLNDASARIYMKDEIENFASNDTDKSELLSSSLMSDLKRLRFELAKGQPVFKVVTQSTLDEICRKKPTNMKDFLEIHGIGLKKTEKYGQQFINCVSLHEKKWSREKILQIRKEIATLRKVAPYMLISEHIIQAIIQKQPESKEMLHNIIKDEKLSADVWNVYIR